MGRRVRSWICREDINISRKVKDVPDTKEADSAKQAQLIDGKMVAGETRQKLKAKVDSYLEKGLRPPGLAVILVGDNPASELYVKNKISACKKVGIKSTLHRFESRVEPRDVLETVRELNADDTVDGILVQLPLPSHISEEQILEAIDPAKDADGLHPYNLGCLLAGRRSLRPCTPQGVMSLLEHYGVELEGKRAVVVGRSNLVGKPCALLLMQRNATVTICHSRTKNLDEVIGSADILVVAIGKSRFIPGSWVKEGAVVIDVGIHHEADRNGEKRITGDVDFASVSERASLITPVPGGVGPMTVAQLLANTVTSFERTNGLA